LNLIWVSFADLLYFHMFSVTSFLVLATAVLADKHSALGDDSTSFLQSGVQALHSTRKKAINVIAQDPIPQDSPDMMTEELVHMRPSLLALSCVTVAYFTAFAILAVVRAFNQAQSAGAGPLEKALESSVMGVCFAPMLCVLFLSVYKRADTLAHQEPYKYGLPPTYVQVAFTCAVLAFATQMVFYTGREWTIHKQAGMQVRRVPAFWNNLFNISMIFMYMAIGVTVFGLIEMQQPKELVEEGGEVPMSAGIFCSNALLVLYLSLYAALQIAKTLDVEFRERGTHAASLTDPSRYVIEVLKMGASSVQTAPMLAVAFIAVQLTIEARTEKLPGVVETAMYLSCFALFLQAIVCIITPFITNSELKVVRGTVETPDMVDFATGHPQMFSLMSGIRWICTAILYVGVAITCAYLWSQKDAPAWVILVMHLITYFFTVHFFLWLCFTLRSVNGGSMDALRTLTTAKDTVAICPMLALLFIECWVAALDLTTPSGARGVPQGYGQDYMFVATWALLIQLVMCVANGFVFSLPKDLQVMKVFGNSVRGGLSAIWFVYYLAMVTVYASILIVFMARYTNKSSTASGTGAWFAW